MLVGVNVGVGVLVFDGVLLGDGVCDVVPLGSLDIVLVLLLVPDPVTLPVGSLLSLKLRVAVHITVHECVRVID